MGEIPFPDMSNFPGFKQERFKQELRRHDATALYVGEIAEANRDEPYTCLVCEATHEHKGRYLRNEHRLLVYCDEKAPFSPFGHPVTPDEALALSREPHSDGGSGVLVQCEHVPSSAHCAGKQFYLAHAQDGVVLRTGCG